MLVDEAIVSSLGIGDDSARHGSCYLSRHDGLTAGCLDDDGGAFVVGACLGEPCFHELAVLMADMGHDSVDGVPVGMDIGDAHEDGNHEAAVVEIFVFIDFFDDYDCAVSGCDDYAVGVAAKDADGASEEVDHDEI